MYNVHVYINVRTVYIYIQMYVECTVSVCIPASVQRDCTCVGHHWKSSEHVGNNVDNRSTVLLNQTVKDHII